MHITHFIFHIDPITLLINKTSLCSIIIKGMNQKNQRGLKASSYMYVIKKKSYKGHPKH